MTFGRPAIPTPRGLELRALQAAIEAGRQRIEAIEAEIRVLQSRTGTGTTSSTGSTSASNASLTALAIRLNLSLIHI